MFQVKPRTSFTGREMTHITANGMDSSATLALAENASSLGDYGIHVGQDHLEEIFAFGQDAASPIQPGMTPSSIGSPVQFNQAWLPGFVDTMTAVRRIDDICGMVNTGEWSDEQIVQGVMELSGQVEGYSDGGNTALGDWNVTWNTQTIVRMEGGISIGRLEQERASAMRVNTAESKRAATGRELEIARNAIGFYGYNNGNGRTYGLLNAPGLLPYITAAGGEWSAGDFQSIKNCILKGFQTLRVQSMDRVDPGTDLITIVLPTTAVDYMAQATDFGVSVLDWLRGAYSNVRIVSAPEMMEANAGQSAMYMFADSVRDSGTDGGKTWAQVVPTKFMTLGVEQKTKGYEEAYTNATAGVMCKRPYAVVRFTGI